MDENEEGVIQTGSETWNIADGFCRLLILKPLYAVTRYEMISRYGVEDIPDNQVFTDDEITRKRIEGLNRLKDTFVSLFTNSSFIIKDAERSRFELLRKRLKLISEYLPFVATIRINQISHQQEVVINEEFFNLVLDELIEIKQELIYPINRAGLIFRGSSEFSIDELMKSIVEGG